MVRGGMLMADVALRVHDGAKPIITGERCPRIRVVCEPAPGTMPKCCAGRTHETEWFAQERPDLTQVQLVCVASRPRVLWSSVGSGLGPATTGRAAGERPRQPTGRPRGLVVRHTAGKPW